MTGAEVIAKVKELNLPKGSYIVFGSGPLAAAGIREAGDVDLLVSKDVYGQFIKAGWQQVEKGPNDTPLTHDVYEAHDAWNFTEYRPTLEELLADADWVDGVPFAPLEAVKKWKASTGGPKHLADINLIDDYLSRVK